MSRAFVTDKEDWAYCAKAGERCMYAEPDKDCRRVDCEHYHKQAAAPVSGADSPGVRVVARRREQPAAAQRADATAGASGRAKTENAGRAKTKRAKLEMPRKWGGRSGGNV